VHHPEESVHHPEESVHRGVTVHRPCTPLGIRAINRCTDTSPGAWANLGPGVMSTVLAGRPGCGSRCLRRQTLGDFQCRLFPKIITPQNCHMLLKMCKPLQNLLDHRNSGSKLCRFWYPEIPCPQLQCHLPSICFPITPGDILFPRIGSGRESGYPRDARQRGAGISGGGISNGKRGSFMQVGHKGTANVPMGKRGESAKEKSEKKRSGAASWSLVHAAPTPLGSGERRRSD
jgi:hypothetical protein